MANMEERLETVVTQAEADGSKWHAIVHGDENSTIETENGDVPTVAKQLKDIREAITGGVSDVVAEAESARDEAIAARNATNQLKNDTNIIKSDTEQLKTDTLNIKNQANQIFNNISSATDTAVSTIQTESSAQISAIQNSGVTQINSVNSAGNTQIANVQAKGQKQIERAEAQASQARYYAESAAPAPLGSRLSVPANKKVPDGYEPVCRCSKIPLLEPDTLIFLRNWLIPIIWSLLMRLLMTVRLLIMECAPVMSKFIMTPLFCLCLPIMPEAACLIMSVMS